MPFTSAVSRSDRMLPHAARRPRAWRWLAVLAVVLCVHWIAAQWVERNRETFTSGNTAHVPVQIALLTPERIERSPAETAPHPAPPPEHKARAAASKPREHVLTALRSGPAPVTAASALRLRPPLQQPVRPQRPLRPAPLQREARQPAATPPPRKPRQA
jgi:hypothetical protein